MSSLLPSEICCSIHFLIGQIKSAAPFSKARNPSYKVQVDFGPELQLLQTSAQLPQTYPDPSALVGRWVLGIVNFPKKNIAGFMSEFLLVGFPNTKSQVHLVKVVRDDASPSVLSHLRPGVTLCGWQDRRYTAGSLSWPQFEQSEIRCGRVVAVLDGSWVTRLCLAVDSDGALVEASLPLPLSPDMSECQLLQTLVLYAPSQESSGLMILAFASADGAACFPLGIDWDSQVILHSHLY